MYKMTFVSLLLVIFMGMSVAVDNRPSAESYLLEKTIATELKVKELEKRLEDIETSQNAERTTVEEKMTKTALTDLELKTTYLRELAALRNYITSEIAHIQDQLDSRIRPVIAFNAYGPRDLIQDDKHHMVFQNTFLNEGAAYDANTGMFTAPVTGLYHFTVHTCNYTKKYAVVAIVHNGTEVAVSSQYAEHSSCGSVSTVLRVFSGQTVHVESAYADTHMQTDQYRQITFIGFLIPYIE